ncbi:hypothetical protein RDWZM_007102 [Blomia tropicalis]|uniref:Serine/threonine-protein kinase ATR n=1 Tax=Blomia tropicalis TaxID=40697 RepID=A0A9Q0RP75_BLOTA|nr:hypothetical protein RDWZM_007102 [Blomia tropicalis]
MFLANGCNGCYHGLDDTENEEQFDDDEDEEVPVTDTKELTDSVQDRPDELSEKLVQHILSFGYHWTVLNDQIEFICSLINYDGSWNDHGKKLIIEKDEIISFMIILTNFALKFPEHHSLSKLLGNFFKNLTYASIYWSSNSNPPELEHSLKLDLFADSSAQILKSIETLEETNPILVETIPWLLNSFLLFDILSVKRQLTEEYHCNLMNVIEKVNNLDPDLIQNDETWFAFVEMLGLTIDIEDSIKEKNSYNPEMVKNYVINIIEMAFEDGFVPIDVKPDSNIEHLLQSYYQILAMNALVNFSNHIDISIQQLFAFSEKEISEKLVEILSRFEEPDPCILIDQCTKLFKQSTIVKDLLRFMLPPILLKQNYASEALLKGLRNLTNQPSYKVFQNFIVEILLYIFYKEKGANQQVFEVFEFSSNCLGRSLFPQIYPYRLFFISKCLINYSICPLITKRALSFAYNLDPIVHLDPERTDTILLVQSETFINNDAKWNEFLRDYFSIFLRYCDLCLVRNKMNQIYDQPQMFESFLLLMNLVSEKTVEQYRIKVFGSIRMMFEIDGNQNHKFIIIGFQILADFIKIVSTEYVQSEIVSICLLVFPFLNQFPQEAGKVFNRLFKHTFPKQIYYQLYFIPVVPESTSYEQGSIMAILQSINEIIHKHMGREEIESNSVDMKNLTTIEQFIDYLQSDQFGRKCRNILFVLDHINCGSIPIQEMALTKLLELINQNRELFHQIHSKSLKDCKYLYDDLSWVRLSLFQEGFDGMNQFEKKMYDTLSKIETIADFFRYLIIELSNCAKYATGEQLNLASLCLSAIGAIDPRWMKIKCVTLRVENRLDNRKLLTLPNDPITRIDFTNLKLFRHQNREFKLFLLQTLSNEARHSTQYHIAAAASNAMVKLIKLFEDRRQCRIVDNGDSMVTSSGIIRSDKIESYVNQMAGPTQFRAPNSDVIISQGMNKLDILDELEAVFINERNEPIDRKKHLSRDVSEFITLLENYFFYNLKSISPSLITMEQFFESINPSMSYRTFVSEFIEMLFHCFILDGTSLIPKQRLNVSYQAILSQAYSQMATMNHESCNDRTFSEMLAKLATIQTPIELFYSCYHMLIENLQLAHLLLPSLLIVSLGLGDQESQKRLGEHVRSLINDKLLLNSEYFANELGPMISELLCFLHDVLKEFISNRQLVHNHIIPNLSLRNRAKRFDYEFCGVSIFLDHFQLPEVSRLSYVSHSYYRALFYIEQHYSSLKEKQVSPIVLCHYIQDNLTFLMRIFAGLNDADSINGCSILSRSQFTRLEQQYYQTLARKSNQQLPLCISDKIVKSDIKKIMKGSKPTMEIYENCANYQHILHLLNQDPPKGFQSPLEWYQSIEAYAQPSSESDRLAAQIPSSLTTAPVSPHIVESAKKMNEWDYNESMLNSNGSNLNPIFTSLYSLEAPFMLESKLTEVRNIALTSLRAASFASGPVAYHRAYWNSIVPLHMIYDVYYFAQTLYVQLMESWQTSSSISSMSPDQTVDSVETMFQEMLQQFKLRNSILPSISNSLDMNEDVIQRVLDVQRSLVSIVRHHHLKRQSINADGVPSRPPLSNVLLTIETFRFWIHSLRAALNCGQLDRAYSHMLAAYQLYYEQRDQHNNAFQLDDDEILDFTLNAARVFWYKNDSNSAIKLLKSEIDRKYSDIHRHCCLETARLYDKPTNARDFVEVINTLQLNSSMNCMNFESTRPFVSSRACLMDNSFKLESVSQANLDRYGKIELVYSDYCNHSKQLPMNSLMVLYRAAVIARPKWEKGHYKLAIFLFNMIQEFEINSKTIGVDTSINFVKLEDIIELKNQVIKVLVESLKHDTKRVSVSLKYILDIWTQMGSEYHTIATTSKLPKVYRHFEYTPVQINRVKDLYHRYLGLINTNIVQLTKSCSLAIFLMEVDTLIAHILHPCELVSINVRDILSTLLAEYPHHMSWKFTRCLRATNRRGMISKLIHTTAIKKPSTFFNLQKYYTDFQSFTSLLSDIARYKHRARNRQSSSSSTNPLDSNKFAIRQVCPKLIRILENLGEHRFIMPCNDILLPTLTTVERASTKENFNHFFRGHFIEKVDEYGCSMKSLQAPKRITFLCHDGINRTVLCKAVDDLRKDQLMMNFSNLLNQCYRGEVPDVGTLHESEKHEDELRTRARRKQNRLHIRTYTVCAISDEFGVIEWVHGLQSYKTIVEPLYNKTRAGKKRYQFARLNYIKNASQNDSFRRLENFRKALPNFLPAVFQNWFVNHFADSYSWWNARCNFTWSTAAYSIVGYMLGLGDRHTENLLIDPSNGEMVQVDFNCLFNKGEEFVVPECVPFRLTHNMVSAMGLLGVDGQFRHTAEDVCLLLRQYRSLFVRFTKILIHDPLEEWTSSGECAEKAEKALLGVEARLAGFCSHDARGIPKGTKIYADQQVDMLIKEATSFENIGLMYHGWAPYL